MARRSTALFAVLLTGTLAACSQSPNFDRTLGAEVDEGGFGRVTRTNAQIMSGEISATQALNIRFSEEVPSTITFGFNQATLTPEAITVLNAQVDWIRQFPELKFSVYGHADAVGSNAYNYRLGLRRAQAVVNYFASQGISRSRLQALVSYGETRPAVPTQGPEQANRRTITTVAGFFTRKGAPLNGKYAEVVWREYIKGAERPIPQATQVDTQVNPAGTGG